MRFRGGKPLVYGDPFQTGGGTAAWYPSALTPALWLDASSSGTVTLNSGNVSSWASKAGTGGPFANAIGGQQPAYVASGDADFAAGTVTPAGSQFLTATSYPGLTQATIAFPFRQVTRGSNYYIIHHVGSLNANGSLYIGLFSGQNVLTVRWLNGGGATQCTGSTSFADGTGKRYVVITLDLSQTGSAQIPAIYVDDVAETLSFSSTTATSGTATANSASLFADGSGNYPATCKLPELIVVDRVISGSERAALHAYAQTQWGTP